MLSLIYAGISYAIADIEIVDDREYVVSNFTYTFSYHLQTAVYHNMKTNAYII